MHFFWTGQFVSFHQQSQHTCSCVCVCVLVRLCVCVTICHSDCARHQKSKMAAHFLQIQNAKNKKKKQKCFLKKLFSCCYYFRCVFSCCFRVIFSVYDLLLAGLITCTYLSMNEFQQQH